MYRQFCIIVKPFEFTIHKLIAWDPAVLTVLTYNVSLHTLPTSQRFYTLSTWTAKIVQSVRTHFYIQ